MCNGTHVWDLQNTRMDVDTQNTDPHNNLTFLDIPVNPPYLKHPNPVLNELGLEQKDYYMTCDVCKVLKIKPDTFRQRIYRAYYPEYQKIGVKRIFTLDQIKELIRITENLIRQGVLSTGSSD
jgi:hypothetical protein